MDTLSGMNEYTAKYADTVTDYWYGSESIDNYSPAEYTNSIDAGGANKYNLSESGKLNEYEQNSESGKLGRLNNSREVEGLNRMGEVEHS